MRQKWPKNNARASWHAAFKPKNAEIVTSSLQFLPVFFGSVQKNV
jgi:hypothetical protein